MNAREWVTGVASAPAFRLTMEGADITQRIEKAYQPDANRQPRL